MVIEMCRAASHPMLPKQGGARSASFLAPNLTPTHIPRIRSGVRLRRSALPVKPREDLAGALEAGIHSKEKALAALGDEINAASERGDLEAVRSLGAQFREAQAELDRVLEQWARLE